MEKLPDIETVDLGGGFKIERGDGDHATDITLLGKQLKEIIAATEAESGRKFKIEIEPGTFLAGNTGILVTQVMDIVSTGKDGHKFIKLNTGLNDIARPSLYGA